MAPEYAMEGRFSEKSDVYSFGVLMLEIVKGKKNTHYYNQEWSLGLIGCVSPPRLLSLFGNNFFIKKLILIYKCTFQAWKLWSVDKGLAFADESIASLNFKVDIVRCIHIALLCVQEFPKDRPTIQTVLSMLSREIVELPHPEQPVFAEKWNGSTTLAGQFGYSINELTITAIDGR